MKWHAGFIYDIFGNSIVPEKPVRLYMPYNENLFPKNAHSPFLWYNEANRMASIPLCHYILLTKERKEE